MITFICKLLGVKSLELKTGIIIVLCHKHSAILLIGNGWKKNKKDKGKRRMRQAGAVR
jgi:hypothetical protein